MACSCSLFSELVSWPGMVQTSQNYRDQVAWNGSNFSELQKSGGLELFMLLRIRDQMAWSCSTSELEIMWTEVSSSY